jgi:hypothetical protein
MRGRFPEGSIEIESVAHRRQSNSEFVDNDESAKAFQDRNDDICWKTNSQNQCRELLAAVGNKWQCNVSRRRALDTASSDYGDLA